MQIIGLVGKKQSGKSTAASHLKSKYGYHELSFAKNLKEASKALFGFSEDQVNGPNELKEATVSPFEASPREVLQWLGSDVLRERWPDFHVWGLDRELQKTQQGATLGSNVTKWVISDVRFENELKYIHSMGGTSIRVIRLSQTETTDTHISETEQDNIQTEYSIQCEDGIENVHKEIDRFMHLMHTLRGW